MLTTAIVSGFDHNIQAPVIGQVYFSSVLIAENSEYEVRQRHRRRMVPAFVQYRLELKAVEIECGGTQFQQVISHGLATPPSVSVVLLLVLLLCHYIIIIIIALIL